jgi:hypothetical protein
MNLFWLYDLPNTVFAAIVIGFFVSIGLLGQRLTRRWVKRIPGNDGRYNELINATVATVGVFFGITLGLISVGAWQEFTDISTNVNQEVSSINVLYRAVSLYPDPSRDLLKNSLKEYVHYAIHEEWPSQQKGIVPKGGTAKVTAFQKALYAFEPVSESMKAVHAETIAAFNETIRQRRSRLQSVTSGLPSTFMVGGDFWLFTESGDSMATGIRSPVHAGCDDRLNRCDNRAIGIFDGGNGLSISR